MLLCLGNSTRFGGTDSSNLQRCFRATSQHLDVPRMRVLGCLICVRSSVGVITMHEVKNVHKSLQDWGLNSCLLPSLVCHSVAPFTVAYSGPGGAPFAVHKKFSICWIFCLHHRSELVWKPCIDPILYVKFLNKG